MPHELGITSAWQSAASDQIEHWPPPAVVYLVAFTQLECPANIFRHRRLITVSERGIDFERSDHGTHPMMGWMT